MNGHTLAVRAVTHRYGETLALDDVSLDIPAGEFVALLGPSGCGKTTLLRSVAGFIRPAAGDILIDGERVNDVSVRDRGIGIVFQSYALFPHMTVYENIAYGLRARGLRGTPVDARVREMVDLVRLGELVDRVPRQLSGGQQQRVAVARVLAVQPRLLLLDEPFSALDRSLRLDMQIEIRRLQRELGITTVLVTHDQDEAMSMADRIAVMNRGRVHQFAAPVEVYDRPADVFVNSFIGSTNLLAGRRAADAIELGDGVRLALPQARGFATGAAVWVSVRPEMWRPAAAPAPHRIAGRVMLAMPIAGTLLYDIATPSGVRIKTLVQRGADTPLIAAGTDVHLEIADPARIGVFARNDQ
jgi:putative spermidine/putrescine transport system ATP-binding protein